MPSPRTPVLRVRARGTAKRLLPGGVLLAVVAMLLAAQPSGGASTPVTVSLSVASQIALGNGCTAPASYQLGTVLPDTPALTSTSTPCTMTFQSNNDTAMLRAVQSDRYGTAMGQVQTTWTNQTTGNTVNAVALVQATPATAFSVGRNGKVWRTTNSGGAWTAAGSVPTTAQLRAVTAPTTSTVWAAGNVASGAPTIWRSTDASAGLNFVSVCSSGCASLSPTGDHVLGIAAQDATHAVSVTVQGNVVATADGGTTWTAPAQPDGNTNINGVANVSGTDDYYAADGSGRLLKSIDGGASWNVLASGSFGAPLLSVSVRRVATTDYVYAGTTDGVVLRGVLGDTAVAIGTGAWTQLSVGPRAESRPLASIVASTKDIVTVGSEGGRVYTTANASTTATFAATSATGQLGGQVEGLDASTAGTTIYAAIGGGNVQSSTTSGSAWTEVTPPTNTRTAGVQGFDSVGGRNAYMAMGRNFGAATLQRTTDGGATWSAISSGVTSSNLLGVSLVETDAGPVRGVAVGEAGAVSMSGDAFAATPTWTSVTPVTTSDLRAVAMAPHALVGWAVGDGGTIVTTVDGGATWTVQASSGVALNAVVAVDETTAFAAGAGGTLLRTTDGGATWTALATGTTRNLQAMAHPTPDALYASGTAGVLVRSANPLAAAPGSVTFSPLTVNGTYVGTVTRAMEVVGTAIYLAGESGTMRVSLDGGVTWASQFPLDVPLRVVKVLDRHSVWAGGESGRSARQNPAASISDFGAGTSFQSASTSSTFGVCVQSEGATTIADWTVDTANVAGRCEALDTDPWRAVPVAPTKVAHTTSGQPGSVSMVFGARPSGTQATGLYTATVVFEALAPDA